jgi:outer membrane protein OmpA-like peptidoglycan-associated protein
MRKHSVPFDDSSIDESGAWLSVSDLMAGLLMVFILLLVSTLAQLLDYENQAKSNRVIIIEGLQAGLHSAGISSVVDSNTGSVSLAKGLKFKKNSAVLSSEAKRFLDKLIPVYSQVIFLNDDISNEVLHLIVEGHASIDEVKGTALSLSIRRSEAVVNYIETMIFPYKGAFLRKISPSGRGKFDADTSISTELNRNVIFRFEFQSHDVSELIKSQMEHE